METTTIYFAGEGISIPAVETTYSTEMSVANSYLCDIKSNSDNLITVGLVLIIMVSVLSGLIGVMIGSGKH